MSASKISDVRQGAEFPELRILLDLISPGISTYEISQNPRIALICRHFKSIRMRSSGNKDLKSFRIRSSIHKDLKSFRISTYKMHRGRGEYAAVPAGLGVCAPRQHAGQTFSILNLGDRASFRGIHVRTSSAANQADVKI
jgi:hypothetical protein